MQSPRDSRLGKWLSSSLVYFGPGLLLAITAAGEAGITEALEIGAHYGIALTWVIIITLIFKFAFTTGIARYTLATGKTIFEGVSELPGPKNWGSYFTIICYLIETLSLGAMCIFMATFLDYLFPGIYHLLLIGICILLLVMLVLRTYIYHHFELVMAIIVILLAIAMVFLLCNISVPIGSLLDGLKPNIPEGSESSILAIIGVVGSGLNLMLYSVWLEKRIRVREESTTKVCALHNEVFFKRYIKSIRIDLIVGFTIVAIITLAFMALGYAAFQSSFLTHETVINLDTLLSMTTNLIIQIPFGPQITLIVLTLIFFGSITVGVDARASAVTKILKDLRSKAGKPIKNTSITYNICLLVFVVIMAIALLINNPTDTIRVISVLCALMFGIFGFILLYLNSKLPNYARGSRIWMLFIAVGSILSIVVALLLQKTIINTGFPLIKNLIICLLGVYIFSKTPTFKRFIDGVATISDKFWLIFLFSVLTVLGTVWGSTTNFNLIAGEPEYFIANFSSIGPILAGFIGGPIPGLITGIVGGLTTFLIYGNIANLGIPSIILPIFAGLVAGIAIYIWKGKLTYLRAGLLGAAIEIVYIFSFIPTYIFITGTTTVQNTLFFIGSISLPMIITTVIGVMFFVYIIRKKGEGIKEPMNPSNRLFLFSKRKRRDGEEK